jgi:hypothetical protein
VPTLSEYLPFSSPLQTALARSRRDIQRKKWHGATRSIVVT